MNRNETPQIIAQSYHGLRIKQCEIIFMDEVTMCAKHLFEAIERVCRELADNSLSHLPFGGKLVIISGDFPQSLCVVKNGKIEHQVANCIQYSHLWRLFEPNILRLNINMRQGEGEKEFSKWLRNFGTDPKCTSVKIPKKNLVQSRQELIDFVTDKGATLSKPEELIKRVILAPLNRTVDEINNKMLHMLKGPFVTYYSTDKPLEENPLAVNAADNEEEQLNAINPASLPPHKLDLAVDAIVILIRNIDVKRGLVNGARMRITKLGPNMITAEAINGASAGTGISVHIIRAWCDYEEENPFGTKFRRMQFPFRLAWAMTIMKAQGQTVERLGLDLTDEVFAHGNLYTALSRVTKMENFRIYAPFSPTDPKTGDKFVKNIVAEGINFLNEKQPTAQAVIPPASEQSEIPQAQPQEAEIPQAQPPRMASPVPMEVDEMPLAPTQFSSHWIEGDGNCFFRGISYGLHNGDQERHDELRNQAVAKLQELDATMNDGQRFNMLLAANGSLEGGLNEFNEQCQNNLTNYATRYIARGRTWAGELEAMVLAHALQRTLIIIRPMGDDEESAVYLPDLTTRRHIVNGQYHELWVLENNPLVIKYDGRIHFEAITLNRHN
jgi:hypothetical protein